MATIHHGAIIPPQVLGDPDTFFEYITSLTPDDFNVPIGPHFLVGTDFGAAGTVVDIDEDDYALMSTGIITTGKILLSLIPLD